MIILFITRILLMPSKDVIRQRTKKGLVSRIYSNQRRNSRQRNHQMPGYDLKWLRNWLHDQRLFHELHDAWVQSGYKKSLAPSVDRINDGLPYIKGNIQLMTWCENNEKSHADVRSGKIKQRSKPVMQFDLSGNFIARHTSGCRADHATGVNQSHITDNCNGKRNQAGGFVWLFAGGCTEEKIESAIHAANTSRCTAVKQIDKSGVSIRCFDSLNEASDVTGISAHNISKVLSIKHPNKSAGGFVWEYA